MTKQKTQGEIIEGVVMDELAKTGVTYRKGELRQPKARKDLRDKLAIYPEPVFGYGAVPSTRGHSTLSTNGHRREGFRGGHKPSLDVYDNRRDMGMFTPTSLTSLSEMAEAMDEGVYGEDIAGKQHRFETRDLLPRR